jgi:hypothetical protein
MVQKKKNFKKQNRWEKKKFGKNEVGGGIIEDIIIF